MHKMPLLMLSLTTVCVVALATLYINSTSPKQVRKSQLDAAINQAKLLYSQKMGRGEDFSNGPCLSDALMPGWVVDIAHNPRLPIDDLAENQCPSYREGRTSHLVELDTAGNLIRAK